MKFEKYQHIERLGTNEVQNIEFGECYVFPKIDGTNASVWFDGVVCAGSRTRELSLESDNAGFYRWASQRSNISDFFNEFPDIRLFGEWLVPHSLKTYRENTWRKFYVFDVVQGEEESIRYLPYEEYKPMLEKYEIDFIPPIAIIKNGSYEQFINQLEKNVFLIEDGKGAGEGVVVKRYDYVNKYNRITWAKIVTSEFKEKHAKEMGASEINGKKLVEEDIAKKYITQALVDKEYSKIESEDGWSSKFIPRLLNTVYYSLIKEDGWDFVKEFNFPVIDYGRLRYFVFAEVKLKKQELF